VRLAQHVGEANDPDRIYLETERGIALALADKNINDASCWSARLHAALKKAEVQTGRASADFKIHCGSAMTHVMLCRALKVELLDEQWPQRAGFFEVYRHLGDEWEKTRFDGAQIIVDVKLNVAGMIAIMSGGARGASWLWSDDGPPKRLS